MRVTKRFRFEAAHWLPYHDGKCRNLHGHSYVLDVTCAGHVIEDNPGRSDSGMVIDFADVGAIVKPLVAQLDHKCFNDVLVNPTAERILGYIVARLLKTDSMREQLAAVRLYETADCWVDWERTDHLERGTPDWAVRS